LAPVLELLVVEDVVVMVELGAELTGTNADLTGYFRTNGNI